MADCQYPSLRWSKTSKQHARRRRVRAGERRDPCRQRFPGRGISHHGRCGRPRLRPRGCRGRGDSTSGRWSPRSTSRRPGTVRPAASLLPRRPRTPSVRPRTPARRLRIPRRPQTPRRRRTPRSLLFLALRSLALRSLATPARRSWRRCSTRWPAAGSRRSRSRPWRDGSPRRSRPAPTWRAGWPVARPGSSTTARSRGWPRRTAGWRPGPRPASSRSSPSSPRARPPPTSGSASMSRAGPRVSRTRHPRRCRWP